MNPQSHQQQPSSQSQESQQTPPRSHKPRLKKSRKMSTGERAALIGAAAVIIASIITAILGPVISKILSPTPTPTVTPTTNTYPPSGWVVEFTDPLKDNSKNFWFTQSAAPDSCEFKAGVYQFTSLRSNPQGHLFYCYGNLGAPNFALEVKMTIIEGDQGGIIFRSHGSSDSCKSPGFYYFYINQAGSYGFDIYNNKELLILRTRTSPAIHSGFNQPNLIAVVAQGNTRAFPNS